MVKLLIKLVWSSSALSAGLADHWSVCLSVCPLMPWSPSFGQLIGSRKETACESHVTSTRAQIGGDGGLGGGGGGGLERGSPITFRRG